MKGKKSWALAALLVLAFGGVQANAMVLNYNNRNVQLNSCGGFATLTFLAREAVLTVSSARCNLVQKDGGYSQILKPEYVLRLNTVAQYSLSGGGYHNVLSVDTRVPVLPSPLPPPRRPSNMYERRDIFGNGQEIAMGVCGGTAYFHQTFWTETPKIKFSGVTKCTYYIVLSAQNESEILDATHSRLIEERPGRWGREFTLPNRWGRNTVVLRLQSETGKHIEDIVVHFVEH